MKDGQHIVIIDDDRFNNLVCTRYIEMVGHKKADIVAFTDPTQGLDHIREVGTQPTPEPTILLLDLNMPVMSGWELLEEFEKLDDHCKAAFTCFIVTSSLDPVDHRRAAKNPRIAGLIVKPVDRTVIANILDIRVYAL